MIMGASGPQDIATGKIRSITLIVFSQIAAMTLWFSATAAASDMVSKGLLSGQQAGLLTSAVQLGFVAGTCISAFWGLADRFDPRRLFAACALAGAGANGLLLVTGFETTATVILRFITGMLLAGIYPVGMKMAVAWTDKAVGLMIGTLVGALTLGSSLPHLFNAISGLQWQTTIKLSTVCAVLAAAGILLIRLGPAHRRATAFRAREALHALRQRPMLLANIGYLGHMWELYAMWAWIGVFLAWAFAQTGSDLSRHVGVMTFLVIAAGALGSVLAGLLADRFGRTLVTSVALVTSGTCAAVIGLLPAFGPVVLVVVALVWGLSVVADSAQFSACVTELAEPHLVGTMLTIQTSMGFLLTFLIIQGLPFIIDITGWRYAFSVLAIGPVFGVWAMLSLRRQPEAVRLSNGRR